MQASPYIQGGTRILWEIQILNNIDKLRPIPIVGVTYRFEEVTPGVLAYLRKTWSSRSRV
jgi:hypothetical protein